MKNPVESKTRRLLPLLLLAALGGCAVYDPGYGYGNYGGYAGYSSGVYPYYGDPIYPAAPLYGYGPGPYYSVPGYLPAPVLQFNYRNGGGYRHHDGRGPGWRGGDRGFRGGRGWGQGRGSHGGSGHGGR